MIWVETPSNPLLKIIDIKKIRESLKDDNIIIVCDNTFASPYNQQPINNGADVVIHSSTKYLGGHSDIIGGALIINCLLYTSPSPRDTRSSRMPSSA